MQRHPCVIVAHFGKAPLPSRRPRPRTSVVDRPQCITLAFKRLCAELEIEGTRLTDLRHFATTNLLSAGIDVQTVSGRLGRANAATTLGTYAHFVGAADRRAVEVLGVLLGSPF